VSTKTLISVAEFDRLVEPDELRYELDEGELIEMTRPRVGHNRVVMEDDPTFLAIFAEESGGGVVHVGQSFRIRTDYQARTGPVVYFGRAGIEDRCN
jgi:hypothetical protein